MSVTITNILNTAPYDLAVWVSDNVLNVTLPIPGPNTTLNVQTELLPIVARLSNNMALVTNLHNVCIGAKSGWTIAKRLAVDVDKKKADDNVTTLGALVDILYRTIQTLDAQRESASRLMTGTNHTQRLGM